MKKKTDTYLLIYGSKVSEYSESQHEIPAP